MRRSAIGKHLLAIERLSVEDMCCYYISLRGQIDAVLIKSEENGHNLVIQVSIVDAIYKHVARNELPDAKSNEPS